MADDVEDVRGKSVVTGWKRRQVRGESDVVSDSVVIMTASGMGTRSEI